MIGVRISSDVPMAIVGSPGYFNRYTEPRMPDQLSTHRCITVRLNSSTTLNAWRLLRDGRKVHVRTAEARVFDRIDLIRDAALAGLGLANLPRATVDDAVRTGDLWPVLDDWTVPLPGYHLCYPHRRHTSRAFHLVIETLRHRS